MDRPIIRKNGHITKNAILGLEKLSESFSAAVENSKTGFELLAEKIPGAIDQMLEGFDKLTGRLDAVKESAKKD